METGFVSRFLIVILSICAWQSSHAQITPTKIELIDSLMERKPKPILILLSTDWCTYCAMQKHQIQKNETFLQNADQFYFVNFNAETKDKIQFEGKEYSYKPTGVNIGTHELAIALYGNTNISYPSWVLLDQHYKPIFRHNGLLNPLQLNKLLQGITETFKNN
jgi:thioredoxin-related protein